MVTEKFSATFPISRNGSRARRKVKRFHLMSLATSRGNLLPKESVTLVEPHRINHTLAADKIHTADMVKTAHHSAAC